VRVVRDDVTAGWFITAEFVERLEWALYGRWGDDTPGSVRLGEVTTIAERWPHLAEAVGRVEILPSTAEEDEVCQRRYGCAPAEMIARMGGNYDTEEEVA
jgi:hypothetical protein